MEALCHHATGEAQGSGNVSASAGAEDTMMARTEATGTTSAQVWTLAVDAVIQATASITSMEEAVPGHMHSPTTTVPRLQEMLAMGLEPAPGRNSKLEIHHSRRERLVGVESGTKIANILPPGHLRGLRLPLQHDRLQSLAPDHLPTSTAAVTPLMSL